MAKKKHDKSVEEFLEQALVPESDQPYDVPNNWVWTRFGSITSIIGGGTPPSNVVEYYENGLIPWISPSDLSGYTNVYISHGKKNITELGLKRSSARLMPKNTVLLSSRAPIGYAAIANNQLCTNQGFKSFLPSPCFIPRYLYYYLKSIKGLLESYASGTTFLELSGKKAASVEFPLPPLAEQQRIVDCIESLFEKLNQAKGLIQEALDSFENRKAAILHKAFSGELTKKWREEHGVAMDSWEEKSLIDIAQVVSGYAFKGQDFSTDQEIPCVKITNVGVGTYQYDDTDNLLPVSYLSEYERFIVKEHDILISLTRSFINGGLKVCIYPERRQALLNQRVALIRYNNNRYLFYYFRTHDVLNYIKEKSKTTNQPNLSIKDLEKLPIPVPSLSEQQEVVSILDSLFEKENKAKELSDLIENIDLMKKSILARAFRGELGTNHPAEESALELLKEVLKQ